MKVKRIILVSMVLIAMMSTVALAAGSSPGRVDMKNGYGEYVGYAELYVNCVSGMRDCDARTQPEDSNFAYLKVISTYDDGTEEVYESSISRMYKKYTNDFDWVLDYYSEHKIWKNMQSSPATKKLSGN